MCGCMVDIQSLAASNRRGEKGERKMIETTAAKYNALPITMGGHKKRIGLIYGAPERTCCTNILTLRANV